MKKKPGQTDGLALSFRRPGRGLTYRPPMFMPLLTILAKKNKNPQLNVTFMAFISIYFD